MAFSFPSSSNMNPAAMVQSIFSSLGVGGAFGGRGFNVGALGAILGMVLNPQNSEKLVQYSYKYKVINAEVILPGKEPIRLVKESIQRMFFTWDYDNAFHPIFELILLLPPKLHKEIMQNKQDVKFHLRIDSDAHLNATGDEDHRASWLDQTFGLIMDDEQEFLDEEAYDETVKNDNGGADMGDGIRKDGTYNVSDYTTEYTISLWIKEDLEVMRKSVHTIAKNCTVTNIIAKFLGDAGVRKMLISPVDNIKSYPEIRIPPMNILNLPSYLDQVYGTYYTGTRIFYDYRCLYYLSKSGVCDAKEQDEYARTVLRVTKPNDAKRARSGTAEDPDNKFYYFFLETNDVSFESPGNTSDVITGNNVSFVDPSNNTTTDVEGIGDQSGKGNKRIVTDNYSNEFVKTTMLSDITEESMHCHINCMDCNIFAFTPNKEFIILFDDSKLASKSGYYRIVKSQVILSKEGDAYTVTGSFDFVFKKEAPADMVAQDTKGVETPPATSSSAPCPGPSPRTSPNMSSNTAQTKVPEEQKTTSTGGPCKGPTPRARQ